MDVNRVKQILSSPANIDVKYHGVSVWIDGVNEEGTTASVHMRGNHNDKRDVAISELTED
ncbi:H-type small acid-soluble spore protein [Bacillus sp. HMF5848]|uniref:H-type small acid-soluble spore protein n=1 Tax=Bacillus sp. HMF5848 TaxID=2495421 RepID=UPI000F77AA53|nr:H-type small acid-soluble spore protein [Bacillus sp. HMF5848]RSK28383.1 H-type small acid-soluble spore protein [Bacillus sp. HMF5848]